MPDVGYINGQFLPLQEIRISPDDRGFLFGDGVYEVIRSYHGVPAFWEEHYARLTRSAHEIKLQLGWDKAEFYQLLLSGLSQSGYSEGKIYIQVTRGVAPRNHAFPNAEALTIFMSFREMAPLAAEMCNNGVSVITIPDIRWGRCDIKSLNLLPNVLAKQQALELQAFEAVFVRNGLVSEGSTSNIFMVKEGVMMTPERNYSVLAGVTQQQVVLLAQGDGRVVRYCSISPSELYQSDEVFIVGTTIEILPVVNVDGRAIADGNPGPVTIGLRRKFSKYLANLTLS